MQGKRQINLMEYVVVCIYAVCMYVLIGLYVRLKVSDTSV